MYTVEYGYYNYPRKSVTFKNYEGAKSFFHIVRKNRGVKRVELICN